MKARKIFCGKNGRVEEKKGKLTSNISVLMKPVKLWKIAGNVRFIPQDESKSNCSGNFHQAVYPVMAIAQCFGVMPVNNISAQCPADLKFTWKSVRFCFAIIVMMSCGLESFSAVSWTFSTRVEFGKLVILIFYVTNLFSFYCFLSLAKNWPKVMQKWHEVEKSLSSVGTVEDKRAICWRIRKTAAIILTLSAIEHILSIISSVAVVLDCPKIKNILKAYYVHNFPQVFKFFSYSHVLGVYVKFIHVTATFVWSYADLFIMIVSQGLSGMFKQINERMLKDKGKVSGSV